MKVTKATKKDLYYSHNHEWVDFQGAVAYVGVCNFKLIGFKLVNEILFTDLDSFKKKGDLIASLRYNNYKIYVRMPVDGKILKINQDIMNGNQRALIQQAETNAWIVSIAPAHPYRREGLLRSEEYLANNKKNQAKS